MWGSTDLSWLLSEAPSITEGAAGNGSLRLAVRPYVAGNLTLELYVEDDGGVERGGANRSGVVRFEVAVLPWNHRPTFALATHHVTILEDCVAPSHGACEGLGWRFDAFATNASLGPPNEVQQTMSFVVTPLLCQVPKKDW